MLHSHCSRKRELLAQAGGEPSDVARNPDRLARLKPECHDGSGSPTARATAAAIRCWPAASG